MKTFLRDNGLTLALAGLFLFSLIGMIWSGHSDYNQNLAEHGRGAIGVGAYLGTGALWSALMENWESEFLQMAAFVVLTAMLFQRGSAESRDPDASDRAKDRYLARQKQAPLRSWLYAHSLGLALAALFLASFGLHWLGSVAAANSEAALHGDAPKSAMEHLTEAKLWFESFQNWQSEFLSTAMLVLLSIFLRQRHSPESKPLNAKHIDTGA